MQPSTWCTAYHRPRHQMAQHALHLKRWHPCLAAFAPYGMSVPRQHTVRVKHDSRFLPVHHVHLPVTDTIQLGSDIVCAAPHPEQVGSIQSHSTALPCSRVDILASQLKSGSTLNQLRAGGPSDAGETCNKHRSSASRPANAWVTCPQGSRRAAWAGCHTSPAATAGFESQQPSRPPLAAALLRATSS